MQGIGCFGMSVYMIVEITVKNSELYSQYVDQVRAIVEQHGSSRAKWER